MINYLWGLFVCAAFVVSFVVGSKVAEKEERRLFDVYKCFNDCKYRNDPNYVLPIKLDDFFKQKNTNRGMTRCSAVESMTYNHFKKDIGQ